ncbi:MAG TPA: ATP-binding protein [Cellulomonas sp.]
MTAHPIPVALAPPRAIPRAMPPDPGELADTWVVDSTAQLRLLRAGLHGMLHAPRSLAGSVVLVASELATNALRHGTPPATVELRRGRTSWLLDVADGAVDAVPVLADRRRLGEGGFGLVVVGRLADEVGWYVEPGRKHVWATLRH